MIRNVNVKKLIEIKEKYGWNQVDICKKLDVSVATWNRWIKGICFTRSRNTLKQIYKVIKKYSN